jgi:hypothetical protein
MGRRAETETKGVIIQRERKKGKKNIKTKSGVPWEYDTIAEIESEE